MVEGIVLWVDGPHDGVDGADGFAGRDRDLGEICGYFGRSLIMFLAEFGEEGDASEVRTELVMNVLGDARAFLLEGMLLLQIEQLSFQAAHGPKPDSGATAAQHRQSEHSAKPPGLPEWRQDVELDGGTEFIPDVIRIACSNMEGVFARRKAVVGG